jgi:hypothetical protein
MLRTRRTNSSAEINLVRRILDELVGSLHWGRTRGIEQLQGLGGKGE